MVKEANKQQKIHASILASQFPCIVTGNFLALQSKGENFLALTKGKLGRMLGRDQASGDLRRPSSRLSVTCVVPGSTLSGDLRHPCAMLSADLHRVDPGFTLSGDLRDPSATTLYVDLCRPGTGSLSDLTLLRGPSSPADVAPHRSGTPIAIVAALGQPAPPEPRRPAL
ncbi:hypothetical protein BS78_02G160100 [Paspalum vaginatum]|nr:hypothetical protein BS78_02G160100 [Paspalum vaginatum]